MGILPTEKGRPKSLLSEFTTLVYGPPKAGKTTFAAGFPDAVFLATEEGQNALDVARVPIGSWDEFGVACRELAKGEHGFKTVVIDTLDNLWHFCRLSLLDAKGIEYENDGNYGYGKGTAIIMTEFRRVLTKLSALPYGLVMIAHATLGEVSERTPTADIKYNRWTPNLPAKASDMVMAMSDFLLFAEQESDARGNVTAVVRTRPKRAYVAGSRVALPDPLPLDYASFAAAFQEAMVAKTASATPIRPVVSHGPPRNARPPIAPDARPAVRTQAAPAASLHASANPNSNPAVAEGGASPSNSGPAEGGVGKEG